MEVAAPSSRATAFRFEPRRARLDWRLLASVDADRVARETDIDALERALDTVSFGDISVEDPRHLSGARPLAPRRSAAPPARGARRRAGSGPACGAARTHSARSADRRVGRSAAAPSMVKLFRLAQMMIEYLLHVQARGCAAARAQAGPPFCARPR